MDWVDFDGATYVEHEGEVEVLPGIRLLPTPGHTDGHQVVVVDDRRRHRTFSEATWASGSVNSKAARPKDSVAYLRSKR